MSSGGELAAWERRAGESEEAHAALVEFCRLGQGRGVAETARRLRKSRSLLTRWAGKFQWRQRALAWDRQQQREDESTLRDARDSSLSRTTHHLEHVLQLVLARLLRVARQDPVTREISFDPDLTPQVAASLLKTLVTVLHRLVPPSAESEDPADPDRRLRGLTSAEIARLVDFIGQTPQEEESHGTPPTT